MTGSSDSIDFSLSNVHSSWHEFQRGKFKSQQLLFFKYYLEGNLASLARDLQTKKYKHSSYVHFTVSDSKKREITVATIRDRVVHRLLYDYLTGVWDKSFIFDAWSCRKGKGLHKAIDRTQDYCERYRNGYAWQADISKFFDTVDHEVMLDLLRRKVKCPDANSLLKGVIASYQKEPGKGMPIGSLTSQILANVYLNELDRFLSHNGKPGRYLRYGDDWVYFSHYKSELEEIQKLTTIFIRDTLKLEINPKVNKLRAVHTGMTYLGLDIWPSETRITKKSKTRMYEKLNLNNYGSYEALIRKFEKPSALNKFQWASLYLD